MIFKASHRAGAEPFLKVKSLHIMAFLMLKFTVAYFAIHAKIPKNADIACILRCFVIRRPFGYVVGINRWNGGVNMIHEKRCKVNAEKRTRKRRCYGEKRCKERAGNDADQCDRRK